MNRINAYRRRNGKVHVGYTCVRLAHQRMHPQWKKIKKIPQGSNNPDSNWSRARKNFCKQMLICFGGLDPTKEQDPPRENEAVARLTRSGGGRRPSLTQTQEACCTQLARHNRQNIMMLQCNRQQNTVRAHRVMPPLSPPKPLPPPIAPRTQDPSTSQPASVGPPQSTPASAGPAPTPEGPAAAQ